MVAITHHRMLNCASSSSIRHLQLAVVENCRVGLSGLNEQFAKYEMDERVDQPEDRKKQRERSLSNDKLQGCGFRPLCASDLTRNEFPHS
jgi:hypothetical protein